MLSVCAVPLFERRADCYVWQEAALMAEFRARLRFPAALFGWAALLSPLRTTTARLPVATLSGYGL